MPEGLAEGRKILFRGASVMSMDPATGNFPRGDILVDGARIVEIAAHIECSDAAVVDSTGLIAMPGFIDTHHHQFETALRGLLADGLLYNDGTPDGEINYFDYVLGKFAPAYEPEDVYISELVGSLSQLDAGVTTALDVSQIHHSPEHTNAAIQALKDAGGRAVLGYFEGMRETSRYPHDVYRLKKEHFASSDALVTMMMGGEIYLPGYEEAWRLGRELDLRVALHVVGNLGMAGKFEELARAKLIGPDNLFFHMTGIAPEAWQAVADTGGHISLAVPIEMTMRHGAPPIVTALDYGMEPSLSSDVECTMTADFFTQMRTCMALQRMFAHESAVPNTGATPTLLTASDVLRFATLRGAEALGLDSRTGTLTVGKDADIILLDANALNVTPLNNVAGTVVTLMERSNVDSVMVAGKFRKWAGAMVDIDMSTLRAKIEDSRNRLFERAGMEVNLFPQRKD